MKVYFARLIFIIFSIILAALILTNIIKQSNTKENYKTFIIGEKTTSLDKNSIVFFFNPGCEHCEDEGEALSANSGIIKKKEILMISLSPRDSIKAYAKRHRLERIPNIHFATDSLAKLHMLYGVQTIPTTFIYGSDGKLRKRFNGEVSIKALLRELR